MTDPIKNKGALLSGKLLRTLSPEQETELEEWLGTSEENRVLFHDFQNPESRAELLDMYEEGELLKQKAAVLLAGYFEKKEMPATPVLRLSYRRNWWAAAAVVLLLATGAYFWISGEKTEEPIVSIENQEIVRPGGDGAVLTLADGSQVVLDSMGNGVVALQNGAEAVIRNGVLTYERKGNASEEVAYNTMHTPKGRQYGLVLPDGSKVWLNAASSIRYPTVFNGNTREVLLTGEAYFEVTKDAEKPFLVNVNERSSVEVLGTHFNVNAYENEKGIATTLLEGSVRVKQMGGGEQLVLKRGEQAHVGQTHGPQLIKNADIEKAMAWKNGLFNFKGASLEEVMRQLERWYDIEVVYTGTIPQKEFWGEMGRDLELKDVLQFLEKSNIRFTLEKGRKLMVAP